MPADLADPPVERVIVGHALEHDLVAVLPHGPLHVAPVTVLLVGHLLAGLLDDDDLVAVAAALRDGVAQARPRLQVRQFVEHESYGRLDLAA